MKTQNTSKSLSKISGTVSCKLKLKDKHQGIIGTWKREVLEGLSTMSALNCQVSTPGFRQSVSEK